MSFGKFSYCGSSHFSHRYCDTHIKYMFIGFDDISTEYLKNFKERRMVSFSMDKNKAQMS